MAMPGTSKKNWKQLDSNPHTLVEGHSSRPLFCQVYTGWCLLSAMLSWHRHQCFYKKAAATKKLHHSWTRLHQAPKKLT